MLSAHQATAFSALPPPAPHYTHTYISSMPIRDEKYYFDDGSCIFRVDDYLFNVSGSGIIANVFQLVYQSTRSTIVCLNGSPAFLRKCSPSLNRSRSSSSSGMAVCQKQDMSASRVARTRTRSTVRILLIRSERYVGACMLGKLELTTHGQY